MSARTFFLTPHGGLRAPWRLIGFILVATAATLLLSGIAAVVAPPNASSLATGAWIVVGALLLAHFVMLRLVDKKPWSTVGLGVEHLRPATLAMSFGLGAFAIGIPSGVLLAMGWLEPRVAAGDASDWWRFAGTMTLFLAPAALLEELMMRGYPFAVLRDAIGTRWTLVVTSVVFGLLHWQNPGAGPQPLLLVTLAGFFLGGVLIATGSLYAAWLAHFAWNWAMAVLLHTDVSGFLATPPPGYRVVDAGPDWATGGAWGPEGGIGAALGMGAGFWYLNGLVRRQRRGGAAA